MRFSHAKALATHGAPRQSAAMGITRKYWVWLLIALVLAVALLTAMDRPPICTCGFIKFWEGEVNGPGNSQHIADWYTFSHIIHGFLFYGLMQWRLPDHPLGRKMVLAAVLELVWEFFENSPAVIDRYREATIAAGYAGDSILNSIADCGWMLAGFLLASRLKWKATFVIAIAFELMTLAIIRDNLTLNVLMLVWPIDAIKSWQAAL